MKSIELIGSKFWELNKVSANLRNEWQGEPKSREFLPLGDYAIGDDGCVYQVLLHDQAESFLIYDNDEYTFNYAEDGEDYSLISDGVFDAFFAEISSETHENEAVRIVKITINDKPYYREYDNEIGPEDNPADLSHDTMDITELDMNADSELRITGNGNVTVNISALLADDDYAAIWKGENGDSGYETENVQKIREIFENHISQGKWCDLQIWEEGNAFVNNVDADKLLFLKDDLDEIIEGRVCFVK